MVGRAAIGSAPYDGFAPAQDEAAAAVANDNPGNAPAAPPGYVAWDESECDYGEERHIAGDGTLEECVAGCERRAPLLILRFARWFACGSRCPCLRVPTCDFARPGHRRRPASVA